MFNLFWTVRFILLVRTVAVPDAGDVPEGGAADISQLYSGRSSLKRLAAIDQQQCEHYAPLQTNCATERNRGLFRGVKWTAPLIDEAPMHDRGPQKPESDSQFQGATIEMAHNTHPDQRASCYCRHS